MTGRTHQWDPFRGEVPFQRDEVKEPRGKSNAKPAFITWGSLAALLVMVISALGAAVGKLFYEPWLIPCVIALAASTLLLLAFAFGGDYFYGGGRDTGTWLFSEVARARGWSFKKVKRSVRSRIREYEGAGPSRIASLSSAATVQSHDPEIEPAFRHLPELMEARPGRLVFPVVQAVMRGRHPLFGDAAPLPGSGATAQTASSADEDADPENSLSFWYAAGLLDSNLALAAKELRTDARGRGHRHGYTFTALVAFHLESDTGIRAACLAKPNPGGGAATLEDAFSLSLRSRGEGLGQAEVEQRFERLLSSRAREQLLDLERSYHCQMILNGDTVFFTAHDVVPGDRPDEIGEAVVRLLAAFVPLSSELRGSATALGD